MIFVDTSALFASIVSNDPNFQTVNDWLEGNTERLVATDYVIDEILTLLRARGYRNRALALGREFFEDDLAKIEWVGRLDVEAAWTVYRTFADKDWSFTDCVSKAVMERLGITTALSTDHHFRQFGTIQVVP